MHTIDRFCKRLTGLVSARWWACLAGALATGCGTDPNPASAGMAAGAGGAAAPASSGGGSSQCAADETLCSGSCVLLSADPLNCGACGLQCPVGQGCVNGACICPGGLTDCQDVCVDTSTDPSNCGACGVTCPAGVACVAGSCVSGTGGGGGTGGVGTAGSNSGGVATGGLGPAGGTGGTATGGTGTGGTASGGTESGGSGGVATGGTAAGGAAAAGANSGGSSTGGSSTGGTGTGGSSTGGTGTGGTSSGGASTGGSTGSVFSDCRFHFGTIDTIAIQIGSSLISELDFFTPGWMVGGTFDQGYVCDEANPGGSLADKVPIVVAYVAAAYVKRLHNLCDCNVGGCSGGDLCQSGAQYIAQDWTSIVNAYQSYSQGYASCYGTTRPIIFAMEPDWYQYTADSQSQAWTWAEAGQRMSELVSALGSSLPNARFSMDVSPWVGPSNGSDSGQEWFSNFDMGLFTFVNTSGGGTNADTDRIRPSNEMTWSGLNQATGKPILADTGYGANGSSAGHDAAWDVPANINARMADGVVSIAQYNPNSNWGSTIASIRGQLSAPRYCP
jgi:hypothetical protein